MGEFYIDTSSFFYKLFPDFANTKNDHKSARAALARGTLEHYNIPLAKPESAHVTQLVERKSRFLTQCIHAGSPEQARAFVERVRREHADASHNCWAFVAGAPGDTARVGSSDDGEPHGTAGRPMLHILLHSGIGEICAVVSRWFGGIKLGTGGLVRAYQEAVAQNLATLPHTPKLEFAKMLIELDYGPAESLRREMQSLGAKIENEEYSHNVRLTLSLPASRRADLARRLSQIGNGRAQCLEIK